MKKDIKRYVKQNGIKITDLARELGVAVPTVSAYLNNDRNGRDSTAAKYIAALNKLGGPPLVVNNGPEPEPEERAWRKGDIVVFGDLDPLKIIDVTDKEIILEDESCISLKDKNAIRRVEPEEVVVKSEPEAVERDDDVLYEINRKLEKLTASTPPDNDFALARAMKILLKIKDQIEEGIKDIGSLV